MKKRTRIVAWIMAVYSGYTCLGVLVYTLLKRAPNSGELPTAHFLTLLFIAVQLPFWIGLLMRKAWAWWALVALNSFWLLRLIWNMVRIPGYWIARGEPAKGALSVVVWVIVVAAGMLPLWFLLTDRPKDWQKA